MLTRKQHELMVFADAYILEHGISPTCQEMADALDLKSKSGIVRLLDALEERGYIRRLYKRARCVEIIRRIAPISCPNCGHNFSSVAAPRAEALAGQTSRRTSDSERKFSTVIR